MRNYICFLTCILILAAACAHKAAPLFKDRMKPKLMQVKALNNRQVQLSFSEELDTISLSVKNITFHSDSDTLEIITLYPSLSAAEIMCLTEPQALITYRVTGSVYDTAQNIGIISSKFDGTVLPDTVTPYLVKYSRGMSTREFILRFSESMDTTELEYSVIPDITMEHAWQDLRTCRIFARDTVDSLEYGVTYYLYIAGKPSDVSGNHLPPFITSITPDTAYEPYILKGEVRVNDTLVSEGVVVLSKKEQQGIAFVRNGSFSFDVRDQEAYTIEALTSGFYGSGIVWFDSVNTILLSPSEKTIDSIIR